MSDDSKKEHTVPANLDTLTPEKGNALYQRLRLEFKPPARKGTRSQHHFVVWNPYRWSKFKSTKQPELRFRALLSEEVSEVQLALG